VDQLGVNAADPYLAVKDAVIVLAPDVGVLPCDQGLHAGFAEGEHERVGPLAHGRRRRLLV
jgi:hypothetical protein